MPRVKQEIMPVSLETREIFREVRHVLNRQDYLLSDNVPEDTCVVDDENYMAETEPFMVAALLQSAIVNEAEVARSSAQHDPWAEAIMLTDGFVTAEFQRFTDILAAYKHRAEGCGCTRCWREYLDLKKRYEDQMLIPYSEGKSDAELIAAEIELYAPELPESDTKTGADTNTNFTPED